MGRPVVHFEIMGKDRKTLESFYSQLFDWRMNFDNPMSYGTVEREENLTSDGIGIGGGVGVVPEGMDGHVTFYVGVPDVAGSLEQAESLGGQRLMGPEKVMEGVEIGVFSDPEGHVVGLFKTD